MDFAELNQCLLSEVGVKLDLVDLGRNASVAQNVEKERTGSVAEKDNVEIELSSEFRYSLYVRDTNVLCDALVDELLHRLPSLRHWDIGYVPKFVSD